MHASPWYTVKMSITFVNFYSAQTNFFVDIQILTREETRDTPYSRSVIPLFSCPLSWSVHYNLGGDGSCRLMMEAVVPSWKLSRLLTVAMSKQDFSARKLKCHFFIMVYKSLLTNVFTWFCLILNKICGRKSATWPWHTAASPNPIRQVH